MTACVCVCMNQSVDDPAFIVSLGTKAIRAFAHIISTGNYSTAIMVSVGVPSAMLRHRNRFVVVSPATATSKLPLHSLTDAGP